MPDLFTNVKHLFTNVLNFSLQVRRAAGVISTNRKIGKEHARRIFTFVTSTDPNQIVK